MNERIKELIPQLGEPSTWGCERPVGPHFAGSRWSGWSDHKQPHNGYTTPLYDEAQLEKFAELIVRECLGQIHIHSRGPCGDYHGEWYESDILKHFGVEE